MKGLGGNNRMKKRILKPKREKGMPAIHGRTVERLARHVEPVPPVAAPFVQWALGWGLALAAAGILFTHLSLRPDLGGQLRTPSFLLLVFLLVAGSALAAWGSLESSLPAEEKKGRWKAALAWALWILSALVFLFFLPSTGKAEGDSLMATPCFAVVLVAGTLAWAGLGLLISRNAPLHPRRTAFWAGLSSFLLGSAVVTLHCASTNPTHVLLEHFLPVLVYSLLVSWAGFSWFSRWKKKPLPNGPHSR